MPISDLLASISGGANTPPPKRKAEDDLKPLAKVPRKDTIPPRSNPLSRPLDRPHASSQATNGNGGRQSTAPALKPLNGTNRVTKPASASARPPTSATAPARQAPPVSKGAPPKKGSYAEVLARAKKAQEAMGQVGKIQHKKSEKKEIQKVPVSAPAPVKSDPRGSVSRKPAAVSTYQGTSKAGPPRPGMNGSSGAMRNGNTSRDTRADRAPVKASLSERDRKAGAQEEEKKVKKAAMASTGYTGTARPRPGAAAQSKKDKVPRGGALLNRVPQRRVGGHSSRYEDDYDEELDDFIEYDDEEDDQGGPRYRYDSDGSSDMEAGMSDIDDEERQAERIARREDIKEQQLEQSLKAAKEERKRRALEEMRARRR